MRNSTSRQRPSLWCGIVFVTVFMIFVPAIGQEAPLKVIVDKNVYLVRKGDVSRDQGTEPIDSHTRAHARFTARVLDGQILRSSFNKQMFDPAMRAAVFSEEASGRLMAPWRKQLRDTSPSSITNAKDQFKTWIKQIGTDPRALTLAVVNEDYLEGLAAYRENAAIYFAVVHRGDILTYDAAFRFVQNEWLTLRLAVAKSTKERINQEPASNNTTLYEGSLKELRQQFVTDIVPNTENARTPRDLESDAAKMREIVERAASKMPNGTLKSYLQRVAGLLVKFEIGAVIYGL